MAIALRAFAHGLNVDPLDQRFYQLPLEFPGQGLVQAPVEFLQEVACRRKLSLRPARAITFRL